MVFWTSKLFPDTSIIIIPLNKCHRIVKKGFWSFNYRADTTFQRISSIFCAPKFILIHMDEDTKLCYQIQLRLIFWSISYRKTCVVLQNIPNKELLEENFLLIYIIKYIIQIYSNCNLIHENYTSPKMINTCGLKFYHIIKELLKNWKLFIYWCRMHLCACAYYKIKPMKDTILFYHILHKIYEMYNLVINSYLKVF